MVPSSFRRCCLALCALLLGSCELAGHRFRMDDALQLGAAGAWQTAYGQMAHRGIELGVMP